LTLLEIVKRCTPNESSGSIRRLIEQRGVELMPDGKKPSNPQEIIDLSLVKIVRVGKRHFFKLL